MSYIMYKDNFSISSMSLCQIMFADLVIIDIHLDQMLALLVDLFFHSMFDLDLVIDNIYPNLFIFDIEPDLVIF